MINLTPSECFQTVLVVGPADKLFQESGEVIVSCDVCRPSEDFGWFCTCLERSVVHRGKVPDLISNVLSGPSQSQSYQAFAARGNRMEALSVARMPAIFNRVPRWNP
ncbi:MAG: hypothetical protein ACXU95_14530 [Isosphaeraceae bacterium]